VQSPRAHLAVVRFLNAAPLAWGLQHGPQRGTADLQFMLPARCSDALRAGLVDGALLSSIEFQRIDGLSVVPGVAIGSAGPVRSVLLISHCPMEEIRSLALDRASRTSACLAQIILRKRYGRAPAVNTCEPNLASLLRGGDATLLIGDPALVSSFPGLRVYDLGEEWQELTNLPFVYAFWTLRKGAPPELAEILRQSATFGREHIEDIVRSEAQALGLPLAVLRHYLTENLRYSFDERSVEGLRTFYRFAHELGLTAEERPLTFVGDEPRFTDP
jgi:chorismate dehydratase